jgi:type IV secretion system protein VirD4
MSEYVPRPQIPTRFKYFVILGLGVFVALQASTQFIAHRLGYHDLLGAPLIDVSGWVPWALVVWPCAVGAAIAFAVRRKGVGWAAAAVALGGYALGRGPIYTPTDVVPWMGALLGDEAFQPLMEDAFIVITAGFVGTVVTLQFAWDGGFRLKKSDSHGSSQWGTIKPLLSGSGLIVGKRGGKRLRYDDEGHLMTVAPTRSGKGVGPVVSNLLSYPGSVVVTDPKGENYAVTAAWRRSALHHEIVALDPFDVVGGQGAVNVLDVIDEDSPTAIDDARTLAETIVAARGKDSANAAFFDEEARGLLSGFILYVCHHYRGPERSLGKVRELITMGPDEFKELLEEMAAQVDVCHGIVARTAHRIMQKDDRERGGVVSTAQSYTHFLDSPQAARCLSYSSVRLEDLKTQRITLYLVLPMDKLDAYSAFLRLIVTTSLMAIVRERRPARERVVFLLDEFANLGRMESVVRAYTLLAGYGATVWAFVQNLAQLKGIYGDRWEVFLDVDVFQSFGTNDLVTAEYVSKLTGDATVFSSSQVSSRSSGKGGRGRQRSFTKTEKQRKLLTPDEVLRMPKHEQLIFMKSHPPIRAERIRYFDDEELAGRADENPLFTGSAA